MIQHRFANLTPAAVLTLVAASSFRPFTASDWMGFQGCTSDNPLIADQAAGLDGVSLIIDGSAIALIDEGANWLQLDTATGELTLV